MLNGTYDVVANTRIGDIKAVITLEEKADKLIATAKARGLKKKVEGQANGDAFSFKGEIKILKKALRYDIRGEVVENFIIASASTNVGEIAIEGVRR